MGIEVEVGKYYLMRNDEVAYITHDRPNHIYSRVGVRASGSVTTWRPDGVFDRDAEFYRFDLVEELAAGDPRIAEFRALCALEGYSHEN